MLSSLELNLCPHITEVQNSRHNPILALFVFLFYYSLVSNFTYLVAFYEYLTYQWPIVVTMHGMYVCLYTYISIISTYMCLYAPIKISFYYHLKGFS